VAGSAARASAIEAACRKPSCVYPGICSNLNTDHVELVKLYRRAPVPEVKKILIGSGLRYDLAVTARVREGTGDAPRRRLPEDCAEHTEGGPLSKMMKPGIGTYDRFKQMFEQYWPKPARSSTSSRYHRRPPFGALCSG
jgi:radical SAM superfamily enzyme YgiQ (UPF0313 family)